MPTGSVHDRLSVCVSEKSGGAIYSASGIVAHRERDLAAFTLSVSDGDRQNGPGGDGSEVWLWWDAFDSQVKRFLDGDGQQDVVWAGSGAGGGDHHWYEPDVDWQKADLSGEWSIGSVGGKLKALTDVAARDGITEPYNALLCVLIDEHGTMRTTDFSREARLSGGPQVKGGICVPAVTVQRWLAAYKSVAGTTKAARTAEIVVDVGYAGRRAEALRLRVGPAVLVAEGLRPEQMSKWDGTAPPDPPVYTEIADISPSEMPISGAVKADSLLSAIRQAITPRGKGATSQVWLNGEPGAVTVHKAGGNGEPTSDPISVEAEAGFRRFKAWFNGQYLIDAVQSFGSDQICLSFPDMGLLSGEGEQERIVEHQPLLIVPLEDWEVRVRSASAMHLIMPIRPLLGRTA